MTDDGKLTYKEVLCEMAALIEQLNRIDVLEEAIRVARLGGDCRPIIEHLADRSRFQDSENPLEQKSAQFPLRRSSLDLCQ